MQTMAERLAKPSGPGERVDPDSPTSMEDRLADFRQEQRRRGRLAVKVAASALAIVAVGAAAWWQLNPHTFSDDAGFSVSGSMPVKSVYALAPLFANDAGAPVSVHFERITPTLSANSAGATVSVLECRRADPRNGILLTSDTSQCAATTPLIGNYTTTDGTDLIVRISPRHPGTVTVSGLDVSYWDGIRRGRQHITANEEVTFR